MKNLVIHPTDASTDFLKPIYANISEATIIHAGVSKAQIKQLITEHDRIIMMGHGSPSGLFSCAKFGDNDYSGFVIDHTMVEELSSKECIAIWCNADKFMNQYEFSECSWESVKHLFLNYHYLKSMPAGIMAVYGLFDNMNLGIAIGGAVFCNGRI